MSQKAMQRWSLWVKTELWLKIYSDVVLADFTALHSLKYCDASDIEVAKGSGRDGVLKRKVDILDALYIQTPFPPDANDMLRLTHHVYFLKEIFSHAFSEFWTWADPFSIVFLTPKKTSAQAVNRGWKGLLWVMSSVLQFSSIKLRYSSKHYNINSALSAMQRNDRFLCYCVMCDTKIFYASEIRQLCTIKFAAFRI